ncbi:MAG: hypothetical protein KBS84_09655 [Treponema sp.]|nr:hypothetical protein [Candidatus Treponema scatequi]
MKKILSVLVLSILTLSAYSQKKLSDLGNDFQIGEQPSDSQPSDKKTSSSNPSDQLVPPAPEAVMFSDEVPSIFNGIWEGDDRYLMFQEKEELEKIVQGDVELKNENYIWIYLKMFYGWYLDRSAEKTNKKNSKYKYDSNDVVFRDIQNIKIKFRKLIEDENCQAYEIELKYPNVKEPTVIPVAIVGDELYLDFAIQSFDGDSASYSRVAKVSGIKVSKPIVAENLYSLYVTDDAVYSIRYWKTDMPYENTKAFFSDGENKYEVPKHIRSAGNIYTCVTGRRLTIRNVDRLSNAVLNNYKFSEDKKILITSKPYLTRISPKADLEGMMQIVQKSNSRKAPDPIPPFKPFEADWTIEDQKSYDINIKILSAVYRRHKEFCEKYPLQYPQNQF